MIFMELHSYEVKNLISTFSYFGARFSDRANHKRSFLGLLLAIRFAFFIRCHAQPNSVSTEPDYVFYAFLPSLDSRPCAHPSTVH